MIEAIVSAGSPLVGRTVEEVRLFQRYGLNLLAVSRRGERMTERLRANRLRAGDLLVLQGVRRSARHAEGSRLPAAGRTHHRARRRAPRLGRRVDPPVTVALVATGALPVAIAFFGAAVLMILTRRPAHTRGLRLVEWPILVMLAAV